jgi:branched-chain amino acid transport system permease protein
MVDLLLQQLVNGLSAGMTYALVALGLTLIFGVLHVINFAHGELVMLGGFALVLLAGLGVPYLVALPLCVAAAALGGWLVDRLAARPVLRRRTGQSDVLLTTFALSLLVHHAVLELRGPAPAHVPGIEGVLDVGGVTLTGQRLFVLLLGAAMLVGVEFLLRRTRIGREMRAVAQSPFAARVVGIDVARVSSNTFVLAAGLAGLAGALLVPMAAFTPQMGAFVVIKAFVIVVAGGMGNVTGAVLCGLGLGIAEAVGLVFLSQGTTSILVFSLLLGVLLLRPQGLLARAR